ncbi:unnamed protein product [Prunus armeniaca]
MRAARLVLLDSGNFILKDNITGGIFCESFDYPCGGWAGYGDEAAAKENNGELGKLNAKNCKSVITDHWKDIERTSPRQLQGLLMVLG